MALLQTAMCHAKPSTKCQPTLLPLVTQSRMLSKAPSSQPSISSVCVPIHRTKTETHFPAIDSIIFKSFCQAASLFNYQVVLDWSLNELVSAQKTFSQSSWRWIGEVRYKCGANKWIGKWTMEFEQQWDNSKRLFLNTKSCT